MKKRWLGDIIIVGVFFLIYVGLGVYLCLGRHYLPYDALGRLVSAWLVLNGTEVKLASIGFIWPPIPTLLAIPFTVFPFLVNSWIAMVILSALFMAIACFAVGQIALLCGIRDGYRWLFMILFSTNPLMVTFAVNGMSESILVACLLVACYYMTRLWMTDRNTDLIFTALIFGLLPLIRYEFVITTLWSGVLIVILSWRNAYKFRAEEFRNYLEGRLLAYASLAIYPLFLWAITNWFIMGSPYYFLVNDRSGVSLAEGQISSYVTLVTTPIMSFRLVFGVWVLIFILGLVAFFTVILYGLILKRSPFLVGMAGLWLLIPILQTILLSMRSNVPLLRYFIMSVPLGIVLALLTVHQIQKTMLNRSWVSHLLFVGVILLFLLSNYGSLNQLQNYPYQNIEAESWKALTTKEVIPNENVEDAYKVGKVLTQVIPAGSRVLIDTYQFGFAIELGANNHDLFFDFTDPNYDAAVANPPAYVDYLIVPKTSTKRGQLYSINQKHKKLYDQGANWVEFMDVLPSTLLEWKLYKVKR